MVYPLFCQDHGRGGKLRRGNRTLGAAPESPASPDGLRGCLLPGVLLGPGRGDALQEQRLQGHGRRLPVVSLRRPVDARGVFAGLHDGVRRPALALGRRDRGRPLPGRAALLEPRAPGLEALLPAQPAQARLLRSHRRKSGVYFRRHRFRTRRGHRRPQPAERAGPDDPRRPTAALSTRWC
ncbi:unnamed protein product [Ixodes pacificus]